MVAASFFGIRDSLKENKDFTEEEVDEIIGPLSELALIASNEYYKVVEKWLVGDLITTELMMGLLKVWSDQGHALSKLGVLIWKDEESVPPMEEQEWDTTLEMPKLKDEDANSS